MCHNVGKKIEKIEDGSKFAERVMKNGNSYQILMLHKVIVNQMLYLFNNNPKPDMNRTIEFKTDDVVFTEAIRKTFGSIQLVNANDPKVLYYLFLNWLINSVYRDFVFSIYVSLDISIVGKNSVLKCMNWFLWAELTLEFIILINTWVNSLI